MLTLLVTALLVSPAQEAPVQMTTYQMVLLKMGPTPPAPDAAQTMAAGHLAGMADLNRKRVNVLYGPVNGDAVLKGIAILDVKTAEEAKQAFADDPFVKAGAMIVEVRPWMGPKNWFAVPPS